jgi:hypothetical protein
MYEKGWAGNEKKYNYDFVMVRVNQELALGNKGNLEYNCKAGQFYNAAQIAFPDYKHFNGNQTMFLSNPPNLNAIGNNNSRERLTAFHALNYYGLSTQNEYIEIHALQNFKSFFVGKVPLLRKTRAYELAGVNFLKSSSNTYTEAYIGLANIFSILRVDAGKVISNTNNNNWFFRFGLGIEFELIG